MVLKNPPWGDEPVFEWDDRNISHIWEHEVYDFEVEECFDHPYLIWPHNLAKKKPKKFSDRFVVKGETENKRQLTIIVKHVRDNIIRPITAWD